MGPGYPLAESRGEWGSLFRGRARSQDSDVGNQPPAKTRISIWEIPGAAEVRRSSG